MSTHTMAPLNAPIIPADRAPTIGDLVPGALIYRYAIYRTTIVLAELPCHTDQVAAIKAGQRPGSVVVDQPVVCRRCFTTYAATPVQPNSDGRPRVAFRHTGSTVMSRPKRPADGLR